jgi:hypothetical protein
MNVEFLWFDDCPNHRTARKLLRDVISDAGIEVEVQDLNLTDSALAEARRFPGSPTIRIDGTDVEPDFVDPGDYTPRCRLYPTEDGLSGVPKRAWIESAVHAAI